MTSSPDSFADVDIAKAPLKTADPLLFQKVNVGVFVCSYCKHTSKTPKMRCSCLVAFYCNEDCQKGDYVRHSARCSAS